MSSNTRADGPLRKDAQRNRDLLVAAAREIYAERGVDAPLDDIARRAGVGNATLYRRFPARGALIEAVFGEGLTHTLRRGEEARDADDAWAGLAGYLEYIFEGLAADRGANDLMTTSIPDVPSLDALKTHHHETVCLLIRRAPGTGLHARRRGRRGPAVRAGRPRPRRPRLRDRRAAGLAAPPAPPPGRTAGPRRHRSARSAAHA